MDKNLTQSEINKWRTRVNPSRKNRRGCLRVMEMEMWQKTYVYRHVVDEYEMR